MNQANVTDDGVLHPPQDQQNIMNNIITNSPYDPISTFGSDFQQMKMAIVGNTSSISTNNPFIKVNIKPTVIQSVAIPVILNNKNLLVRAPTGMGKTYAFLFPIIKMLFTTRTNKLTNLILVPTRELAEQIKTEGLKLIKAYESKTPFSYSYNNAYLNFKLKNMHLTSKIKIEALYGKCGTRNLSNVNILVACPGKLLDYINTNRITLSTVTRLVLDEADKMMDMGFSDAILSIYSHLTISNLNVLCFSATYNKSIQSVLKKLLPDNHIFIEIKNEVIETITQEFIKVGYKEKNKRLIALLKQRCNFITSWSNKTESDKCIIFVEKKKDCPYLIEELKKLDQNISIDMLQGDMEQSARDISLRKFKIGITNVLVATSIAARGIDIKDISLVINYELPKDIKEYIHRIGRTGREGKKGSAVTFYSDIQNYNIDFIKELIIKLKESKNDVPVDFLNYINNSKGKDKQYKKNNRYKDKEKIVLKPQLPIIQDETDNIKFVEKEDSDVDVPNNEW